MPSTAANRPIANGGTNDNQANGALSTSTSMNSEVIFRDGTNSSNPDGNILDDADDEPIAPIRPPIHSKTKNWYSGFCNRWASLMGVGFEKVQAQRTQHS